MPVRVAVLAQRISTESSVIHIRTKKPLKAVIFVEATNRIYKFANFFWRWTPFRTFRIDPVNESMVGKLLVRLCARTNTGIVRVPRVFLPEVDLSPSPTIRVKNQPQKSHYIFAFQDNRSIHLLHCFFATIHSRLSVRKAAYWLLLRYQNLKIVAGQTK